VWQKPSGGRRYDRTVETRTEPDGARAVMANWEALGRALADRFEGRVTDDTRVFRYRTGLHSGFLNSVLRADTSAEDVDEFAAEQRGWFPEGLPWRWIVGPGSSPADLEDRLRAMGFEARWPPMPAMAIDLESFDATAWVAPGAPVTEILDAAALEDWLNVRRVNLHLDEPTMAAWRRAHGEMGLGPTSMLRQFTGRLNGRPVANCTLFLDPDSGTAGIYHVDVLDDVRGRGFGKAVTAAALGQAAAQGYGLGVLTASPLGVPVYLRLGFRIVGGQQTFVGAAH
jgi:GNAT superfamily N-acetyltransferase